MDVPTIRRAAVAVVLTATLAAPALGQGVAPSPAAARLDLRSAISEALKQSPTLRPAQDAVELAAIRQEVAASVFGLKMGPTFTAGSDAFGRVHNEIGFSVAKRLATGTEVRLGADWLRYGGGESPFQDGGVAVAVSQPLLRGLGPGLSAGVRDAERATIASERGLDDARRRLVLVVAGAYYAAVRQQRLVESGTLAHDRAIKLRRASEARTRVGLATQLDVLRADLLVSQSEAHLDRQRELLADSLDELKTLTGRPLDASIELSAHELELEPADGGTPVAGGAVAAPLASLTTTALDSRLDVREARDRIADAERAAAIARWNLLPRVDLTVTYARRGFGSSSDLLQQLTGGWRFGVRTSYPLDRAAETAAIATAKVTTRAARRTLADLEQRAAADVRRAWRARERAAAGIDIHRKAVALANRQLRLAELRYQRGIAGNFDVVDAESNLFQAESALITAQTERALADLALEQATGALDPSRYLR